eukprot:6056244-Karenia_brevis.AAC.1
MPVKSPISPDCLLEESARARSLQLPLYAASGINPILDQTALPIIFMMYALARNPIVSSI